MKAQADSANMGTLRHDLTELFRELHKAMGHREAMRQREAMLVDQVGLAKGRLELKPKVDAFLEELQQEANERAVGAYSRLLTGLIQDVLGSHAGTVELDLYTNHGLPALDLYIRTPGGKRVSILNHTAGSFINLVCMGLRATATLRSGKRRFIALDEPDCWIRPGRVPPFYSVIDQLSKDLGIQVLVVSHHDPSFLPEGAAVVKLRLGSEGTVEVEADPEAKQWDSEREGIRYIRLKDYRTHSDSLIPLSPGVTAIVGDNSIGKSHVLHALRSVCYGDIEDGDIRDHEESKRLDIEVGVEDGKVINFSRQPGRNPVNEWSVHESDGDVLYDESSGHPLRSGGRVPPDFVKELSGIMRMEGLDPQLSHQLFPVFLLGDTPAKRAAVLSIGRESGHINSMIAKQKSLSKRDGVTVKKGEAEIGDLRERLERMKVLDDIQDEAEKAQRYLEDIEKAIARAEKCRNLLLRFDRASQRHSEAKNKLSAYDALPLDNDVENLKRDVDRNNRIASLLSQWERSRHRHEKASKVASSLGNLPEEPPEICNVENMRRLGLRLSSLKNQEKRHQAMLEALSLVPEKAPDLTNTNNIAAKLRDFKNMEDRKNKQNSRLIELDEKTREAKDHIDSILGELGNSCPTCGSYVASSDAIIDHGGHHQQEMNNNV